MKRTPAAQRYHRRASAAALAYVVLIAAHTALPHVLPPPRALMAALAAASALPIVALIVLLGRYLREETDEYVRNRSILSMLLALGVVLSLSSVLGMLQIGGLIGDVPVFLAFVAWACAWGVARLWLERRDRREAEQS